VAEIAPSTKVVEQLAGFFRRNGYVRRPNLDRRLAAPRRYKKGYEIRLVAQTLTELQRIRRLLRAAGFEPGRAFAQAGHWRQPLYGRQPVARFLELIGCSPDGEPDVA
jgi:hypothetical protein